MSNETKRTAVEQFIQKLEEKAIEETEGLNQIHIVIDVNEYLQLKKQAKEMEKKQMLECYLKADVFPRKYEFETWYNETYGGNK